MVAPCQRFTRQRICTLKFLSAYVHRSTLPQLRCDQQLPQRGSRGTFPFNRVLAKIRGWRAIFIAPTKLRNFYVPPFIEGHSLSLAFARQLPQGGSRDAGWCHSPGCSLNREGSGDFHRPYETQKILAFTIHRGTLPQSRPLGVPAPSEREPGSVPIHRGTR